MIKLKYEKPTFLYDQKLNNEYVVKLGKIKEGEKISILSDNMFRTMILNTTRIKYSAQLFSYLLEVSYEDLLKNIKLVKNSFDKKNAKNKGIVGDYVADINGTLTNIEINNNSSIEVMERNNEYAFRMYAKNNKVGKGYNYSQVIQVDINNFAFEGNDKTIDIYRIRNEEGIVLNEKLVIIQIYVPNIIRKWYTNGIESLSEVERYILSMIVTDVKTSLELGEGMDIVEEYVNDAIEASNDEELLESYDKEWALKDQGRREGFEEGKLAGYSEIALSMLKEDMDINLISRITNLSIEEIKDLKKEI